MKHAYLVLISVAFAAPSSAGVVLWENVEEGMSPQQVAALYPSAENRVKEKDAETVLKDVKILPGCEADIHIRYKAGLVNQVEARGGGSLAGKCSGKVLAALSSRYGQPLDKDKVRGSIFSREGKVFIWNREGVTLRFKRYTNGALGGGGLGAASWSLTYSTISDDVRL